MQIVSRPYSKSQAFLSSFLFEIEGVRALKGPPPKSCTGAPKHLATPLAPDVRD
jgi:hypothetical protein